MKKVNYGIGIILLLVLIYLIYRYNLNNDWTKTERLIFLFCLLLGLINSITLIIQKKKSKKETDKPSA